MPSTLPLTPPPAVTFTSQLPVASCHAVLVLGEKETLVNTVSVWKQRLPEAAQSLADAHVKALTDATNAVDAVSFFPSLAATSNPSGDMTRVTLCTLSAERSRNTGHIRSDLIPDLVSKHAPKQGTYGILLVVSNQDQVEPALLAAARAFPLYLKKSEKKDSPEKQPLRIFVDAVAAMGLKVPYEQLQATAQGIRYCAKLVDTPASELYTDAYVEEIKAVAGRLKCELLIIRGEELKKGGFGGLWGVGKGAVYPPALVILSHRPAHAQKKVAMVGKGIMFDTGGLNIKVSGSMSTMKTDMGGSAAILAAFEAAVVQGCAHELHALLCLAENSVDAQSTRPDDILYMYSGKTVEINNTDAEGRLVLADGVAYATRHLKPDVLIDMATLTGAQLITTGTKHAAILCNSTELEALGVKAGVASGDWVYPILYAPELLKSEFKSDVADMKNSVKNRMNAQTACAGHFIEDHLEADWKGQWMHVDIAGPSTAGERATGYGVGLLVHLLRLL